MQKGTLLYTVLLAVGTCRAFPQYGGPNQEPHQEALLQSITEVQQQQALPSSQHIQSTHHVPQSSPQQQSQHIPGNHATQQTQQAPQSVGHHHGDNFAPVGGSNFGLQCGSSSFDCVPHFQCVDGYINTDGSGLIDIRVSPKATCSHPDYPDVPALCCRIPGSPDPIENLPTVTTVQTPKADGICPVNNVCVSQDQCDYFLNIRSDLGRLLSPTITQQACYLDEMGHKVGVCCDDPQKPTSTPVTSHEVCPFGSACLPDVLCQGEVVDHTGNIVPFTPGGFYAQCDLGAEFSSPGVCCSNPLPTRAPVTTTTLAPVPPTTHLPTINQCGIRQNSIPEVPAQRIQSNVAYNEAQFGEFPWQAIIFFSNFTFKCGASIIGDRWLLTAAHCVDGFNANDFSIRVGEWQVNAFDEQFPYVDASVTAITVHPNFNSRNVHNDIAVIELVEPLSPQYHINSICLPAAGQTFWGQRCISTGWGKDSFTGQYQTIMKKVKLPLVDHHQCQDLLRNTRLGSYFNLDDSFMCAGGEENEDACKGDGGGPLACQDPITGSYVLTGITAWGISCGKKDVPGVYVDVQSFVLWVEAVLSGTYDVNSFHSHSTQNQQSNQIQQNHQNQQTQQNQQNQQQHQQHTTNNQQQHLANNHVDNVGAYGK